MTAPGRYPTIPPPLLFLAAVAAGGLLEWRWPLQLAPYPFRAGLIAGVVMLVAAALTGGWAFYEMQRHRTPVHPGRMPSRLVTTGPFRYTRNPLYVTLVTIATSLAVMTGSAWLLGSAVLLVVLLDRLVIAREERAIGGTFGEEYAEYRRRVRRWL